MQQIRPDLWETATETPMPGLTTHAYLLTRESGNLLFYNTSLRQERSSAWPNWAASPTSSLATATN